MAESLKSVLITGASTGIGATCATRLHRLGYRVFAGVRKPEDGERLRAATSERLRWIRLDVTDGNQIDDALRDLEAVLGARGLDALVNNAGVAVGGPLEYLPPAELRRQLEINVVGLHAVTQTFLPLIRLARGRIVHMGSISGRIASPFTGPYAASKHAVEALTDALRLELAPEGIRVAVIEPGQIDTPIWEKGLAESATVAARIPPEGMARYAQRLKVLQWVIKSAPKRSSPPDAVADAVIHAIESDAPRTRYVVGFDAKLRLWLTRLLPDRMMDGLVLSMLGRLERRVR
jgi:NAD(P)-dependent dehydrogenase (short-subunit alcohol dehydrogenase family)